jgi:hypothetical protein
MQYIEKNATILMKNKYMWSSRLGPDVRLAFAQKLCVAWALDFPDTDIPAWVDDGFRRAAEKARDGKLRNIRNKQGDPAEKAKGAKRKGRR